MRARITSSEPSSLTRTAMTRPRLAWLRRSTSPGRLSSRQRAPCGRLGTGWRKEVLMSIAITDLPVVAELGRQYEPAREARRSLRLALKADTPEAMAAKMAALKVRVQVDGVGNWAVPDGVLKKTLAAWAFEQAQSSARLIKKQ